MIPNHHLHSFAGSSPFIPSRSSRRDPGQPLKVDFLDALKVDELAIRGPRWALNGSNPV
jgi:hypothetical protein